MTLVVTQDLESYFKQRDTGTQVVYLNCIEDSQTPDIMEPYIVILVTVSFVISLFWKAVGDPTAPKRYKGKHGINYTIFLPS